MVRSFFSSAIDAGRVLSRIAGRRSVAAMTVLAVFASVPVFAPMAFAQDSTDTPPPKKKPKKKKTKPAPSASATTDDTAAAASSAPAEPTPAPSAAPAPEPSASAAPSASASAAPSLPNEPTMDYDISDTTEAPGKAYLFVGLRYRINIVPQALESLFVDEGSTFVSNTFGAEIDIRKGNQSTIPWIQYTDYNSGDMLFLQKGQNPTNAAYYSLVNSSLKSVYAGVDELWSVPIAKHLDFEFGFGVGIGVIFGSLEDNWVYENANGSLVASNGVHLSACGPNPKNMPNQPFGCNIGDHQSATSAKVGGYNEANWFNGGPVPVFLPYLSPDIGLRYKPIKQLETRLSVGFSLTGVWFGLSADYGLERKPDETPGGVTHKSSLGPSVRDTL